MGLILSSWIRIFRPIFCLDAAQRTKKWSRSKQTNEYWNGSDETTKKKYSSTKLHAHLSTGVHVSILLQGVSRGSALSCSTFAWSTVLATVLGAKNAGKEQCKLRKQRDVKLNEHFQRTLFGQQIRYWNVSLNWTSLKKSIFILTQTVWTANMLLECL